VKHTPGPWELKDDEAIYADRGFGSELIAEVYTLNKGDAELAEPEDQPQKDERIANADQTLSIPRGGAE
jgi:hypothetical protein